MCFRSSIQIFTILCALLAFGYSELQEDDEYQHIKKPVIPIIKHSFDIHKEGYQFNYETGNGIHAEESGFIKNKGDEKNEIFVQRGTVTYHDEHGHPITLSYIADEHGFQPQGAHLPTPPPIPPLETGKSVQEVEHPQQQQQQQQYEQQARVEYAGHLEARGYVLE